MFSKGISVRLPIRNPYRSIIGHVLTFHRTELQSCLIGHLPPSCQIHLAKRLVTYQQCSTDVTLFFTDGSTAQCDILLAADGLKSACRATLLRELAQQAVSEGRLEDATSLLASIEPTWTGSIAYRSLVPVERLQQDPATQKLDIPPLPVQVFIYVSVIQGISLIFP